MSLKATSISLSAALVLAVASGFLGLELRRAYREREVLDREIDHLALALEKARAEARKLEDGLARQNALQVELQEKLEVLARGPAEERSLQAEAGETESPRTPSSRRTSLRSIGEADARAAELIARGDIEGLLDLAGELLGMGEEGYEKLIQLAGLLESAAKKKDSLIQTLWDDDSDQLMVGSLFRAVVDHRDDLLPFLLYLDSRSGEGELPRMLEDTRKGLLGDLAPILAGFWSGSDPDDLDTLTDKLGAMLEGDLSNTHHAGKALMALSNIRTPRSTDLLLATYRRVSGTPLEKTAIRALAWQGSASALPLLSEELAGAGDSEVAGLLRLAIAHLEGSR